MSFNSYRPFKKRSLLPKYLIVFLLGISFALFFSSALNIVTGIENATQYIKQIVLTSDGTATGTTGIVLDGVNGRIGIGVDTPNNLIQVKDLINFDSSNNTALGYLSFDNNIGGITNTALGAFSLGSNTSGGQNVALGHSSLYNNIIGDSNIAIGNNSLFSNTGGIENVSIGVQSLYSNTFGKNNTAIGYQAGNDSTGDGNVFLGYKAGFTETGNNKLHITNTDTKTLIYGEFDNEKVGINTITPKATLEVNNVLRITPTDSGPDCSVGNPDAVGLVIYSEIPTVNQLCFCDGSSRKLVSDPNALCQ